MGNTNSTSKFFEMNIIRKYTMNIKCSNCLLKNIVSPEHNDKNIILTCWNCENYLMYNDNNISRTDNELCSNVIFKYVCIYCDNFFKLELTKSNIKFICNNCKNIKLLLLAHKFDKNTNIAKLSKDNLIIILRQI